MDSVAEQIGMDPVELRGRNIVREGDESATRQVFTPIAGRRGAGARGRVVGYGEECRRRGDRRRVRMVAVVRDALRPT